MNKTVGLFLLLASSAAAQGTEDSLNFLNLESVWNRAHLESDSAVLDSLWDDNFEVIVPGMRPMGKSDVLDFARSGRMKFQRYETTDVHVAVSGDSAKVKDLVHRTRTINNERVEDHWQFVKNYVRQSGRWRVGSWEAYEAKH